MKKILCLVLAVVICFGFAACGNNADNGEKNFVIAGILAGVGRSVFALCAPYRVGHSLRVLPADRFVLPRLRYYPHVRGAGTAGHPGGYGP